MKEKHFRVRRSRSAACVVDEKFLTNYCELTEERTLGLEAHGQQLVIIVKREIIVNR
jgi:hypothetical protein